jgi:hypothetical protein
LPWRIVYQELGIEVRLFEMFRIESSSSWMYWTYRKHNQWRLRESKDICLQYRLIFEILFRIESLIRTELGGNETKIKSMVRHTN